jgi:hypothetical protein
MQQLRRLLRLLTARYLVSARWGGVQVHPARTLDEAMGWVECYPQVPVTVLKRDGLLSFRMHMQFADEALSQHIEEVCHEFH